MEADGTEEWDSRTAAALKTGSLILDQPVVLGCVLAITLIAWLYLLSMAIDMADMTPMSIPRLDDMSGKGLVTAYAPWSLTELLITASLWIVMVSAMMLPTAIGMILVFADDGRGRTSLATPAFVLGYVLVWTGFALAAVALQWMLPRQGLFHPNMKVSSDVIGGCIFVAAGIYEWSPLKRHCLAECRNAREFLASHWRPGVVGALRVGLRHGVYCFGGYWALMLLLFAVGAMNLIWVAGLSLLVLLQKVMPHGEWIARASGIVMIAAGIYLIVA